MLAASKPDFVYEPRPLAQWLARLTRVADAEPMETRHKGADQDYGRFSEGDENFQSFAEAFDVDVDLDVWHENIMPAHLHKTFGNRGRFRMQDVLHRYRLHYVTMEVRRGKRGDRHSFPLAKLFAICRRVDPDRLEGKRARAALAVWMMRLLFEARLLDDELPDRRYRHPLPSSREAFVGLSAHERQVAILLLDAIGLQIDLCRLRTDTVLVHQAEYEGRTAPVVMASDDWLSWWCYPTLLHLCGPTAPMERMAEKAADLRTRLKNAGLLWAAKGPDGYWRFGPAPLGDQDGSGLSRRELVDFFDQTNSRSKRELPL